MHDNKLTRHNLVITAIVHAFGVIYLYYPTANAGAFQPLSSPSGVYSDLCRHLESGDILGIELIFIPHSSGISILIQNAEGNFLKPNIFNTEKISANEYIATNTSSQTIYSIELLSKDQILLKFLDGQKNRRNQMATVLYRNRFPHWDMPQKNFKICS